MKATTTFVLGAVLSSGVLAAAVAPQAAPGGIVFIDGERVLTNSAVGRQARQQLEAEAGRWQERINAVTQELDTLQRQRQEQALTLNETALARLNEDIEERQVQAERLNDDARRELARLEQQITVDVNTQLTPLLQRFASNNGYGVIFDTSRQPGLLFFATASDVTEDFLALVNASVNATSQE